MNKNTYRLHYNTNLADSRNNLIQSLWPWLNFDLAVSAKYFPKINHNPDLLSQIIMILK